MKYGGNLKQSITSYIGNSGYSKGQKTYEYGAFVLGSYNTKYINNKSSRYYSKKASEGGQVNQKVDFNININCDQGVHNIKSNTHKINNVIHEMGQLENIISSYEAIKSERGNLTPGTNKETIDEMSLA